jgi:hypothetical protein
MIRHLGLPPEPQMERLTECGTVALFRDLYGNLCDQMESR